MLTSGRAAAIVASFLLPMLAAAPGDAGPGDPVTCAADEVANDLGQCVLRVPPADGGQGDLMDVEDVADRSTRPQAPSSAVADPKCLYGGKEIPCVQENTGRWWSSTFDCYVSKVKSPPAKSDPVWEGNAEGAIYSCLVPNTGGMVGGAGTIRNTYVWAATPPAGPAAPLPDPRVLAQEAIARMNLRAPEIGIVPEPGEGSVGVIGMPTWMWVDDEGPHTMGPITRQATAAGHTVIANAKMTKLVWDMGDGTTVTCFGPGTEYEDHYGKQDSPDCGHRYTEQGEYTVTVHATWSVTWAGLGQTGEIPMALQRSATITMGEVQVLN